MRIQKNYIFTFNYLVVESIGFFQWLLKKDFDLNWQKVLTFHKQGISLNEVVKLLKKDQWIPNSVLFIKDKIRNSKKFRSVMKRAVRFNWLTWAGPWPGSAMKRKLTNKCTVCV